MKTGRLLKFLSGAEEAEVESAVRAWIDERFPPER
jgi:hypothetical protein